MKILSVASKYSKEPEEKLITIYMIKEASCPFRCYKNYIKEPRSQECFESIEQEEHFSLYISL